MPRSELSPAFATCGVPIHAISRREAAEWIIGRITDHRGGDVHLCNAFTLATASRDDALRAKLQHSALNLPDGTPLSWIARLLRFPAAGPIRGNDLFLEMMDRGRELGVRHFLYGSTPTTIALLSTQLYARYPGVSLVGAVAPPFRDLTAREYSDIRQSFLSSNADIVWVGLGTPKQDHFVSDLTSEGYPVFIAVGAAFDFASGSKREAPRWLHASGLEWVYRLVSEPRRLVGRYAWGNVQFIRSALSTTHRL